MRCKHTSSGPGIWQITRPRMYEGNALDGQRVKRVDLYSSGTSAAAFTGPVLKLAM